VKFVEKRTSSKLFSLVKKRSICPNVATGTTNTNTKIKYCRSEYCSRKGRASLQSIFCRNSDPITFNQFHTFEKSPLKTVTYSFWKRIVKVIVIGDYAVGKTSLIRRYCEGYFSQNYKLTIGVDFAVKTVEWDDKTRVTLQVCKNIFLPYN
jgi:hypothetical protein